MLIVVGSVPVEWHIFDNEYLGQPHNPWRASACASLRCVQRLLLSADLQQQISQAICQHGICTHFDAFVDRCSAVQHANVEEAQTSLQTTPFRRE